MSGHVIDRLGDILAGRLGSDEQRSVDQHVKDCRDCASEIAWTRRLRQEALRQGVCHLPARRIVELGRTPEAVTAAEREHLSSCADCGGELHWVEGLPASGDAEDGEAEAEAESVISNEPPPRLAPRRAAVPLRVWVLAGVAAAAIVLVVLIPRWGEPDLSGLAVIEPIPVKLNRAAPEPGSFEEHLQLGLAAYQNADYALAAEHLALAVSLKPDAPMANLYLGSTSLLLDDPETAVTSLRRAAEGIRDPVIKEEATWQLANALLLSGRVEAARESLEILAGGGGRRQSDARALIEKLGASP